MTDAPPTETLERRLRFRLPDDVGAGLLRAPLADQLAAGPVESAQIDDLYFDAPDLRLGARGLSLRLRGDRLIATEGRGVVDRRVWSAPAPDGPPVAETLPRPLAKTLGDAALAPLFRARLMADWRLLAVAESAITARVETGSLLAGGVEAPVATVTLILVEGEPVRLLELGLALIDAHGLRPLHEDTGAQGWRLARGADLAPPAAVFADDAGLAPGESVGEALAAVFAACAAQIAGNEAACRDGRRIEGVHQMRVAIRRLRAALTAFRSALPPALHAQLEADCKALMRPLGVARDLDVFLEESAAPLAARLPDEPGLAALFAAARKKRAEAYDALRAALDGPEWTRLLLLPALWRLRETARRHRVAEVAKARKTDVKAAQGAGDTPLAAPPEPPPPPQPAFPDAPPSRQEDSAAFADALEEKADAVAARALERRAKRVLKAGRAVEDQPPETLHDLRLIIKKLRYQAEFFAELFPRARTRPFLKPLKKLQDELGLVQDAVVAADLAEDLATEAAAANPAEAAALNRAAGIIAGWRTAQADARTADAHARWRAFRDAKAFWR